MAGNSAGYGVSLSSLRDALDNHLYPAIAHFESCSNNFNRLRDFDPFQLVGPDPARLSQDFARAWQGLNGPLVDNRNAFVDTIKQFAVALEDVARAYAQTEQKNAHDLRSIANH